jgi:outer membrane receptor protein involved in Fe transport
VALFVLWGSVVRAADVTGSVRDDTGGVLPGVAVELRRNAVQPQVTTTDAQGVYRFTGVPPGSVQLTFALVNFSAVRRDVTMPSSGDLRVDAVLHLSLSADVTVTGTRTFTNLADVENPAENLVGVALSSSQGAVTWRQLEARPVMRVGEVLETVPGVIISQHSGEGKANQYYLRGFNLDHGTDFSTTVAGMPVNMPTHGHGHGYSDLNFMIPELVSGVQFSKGPYFADQGDFATAGAANINYTNRLERPLVSLSGGQDGHGRALVAASPAIGAGHLLVAFEAGHNDGPWDRPDDFRKFNGLARFTRGDTLNGYSLTGMAYKGEWDATDQIPARAVDEGLIGRFGGLDASDGGDSYRVSGSLEWQRTRGNRATRITAYGIGYDLNLFSNFTFLLDDPERGDQFHQADHRVVTGARLSDRRLSRWRGRRIQNTVGAVLRHDDISKVGLYRTQARRLVATTRQDSVLQTSAGGYVQNEVAWTGWLRSQAGLRVDRYRFDVESDNPLNSGTTGAGIVSPKGGVIIGPFSGTELYANAGMGFHSNDARGATITIDPATGEAADRVTPLVRARGTELGLRTVAVPRLHTTLAVWTLHLESELLFVGDAGTTDTGRPSHRFGIELANYFSPRPWLTLDADVSWSRSHFNDDDPAGDKIPGAVGTVVSAGLTVDDVSGVFGSMRLRYFGPRPLIEDDSIRSAATALVNLGAGYKLTPNVRLVFDVFNLFDAEHSDIDYFYESRLAGEPEEGVADIHFHPTIPRTARVGLVVTF